MLRDKEISEAAEPGRNLVRDQKKSVLEPKFGQLVDEFPSESMCTRAEDRLDHDGSNPRALTPQQCAQFGNVVMRDVTDLPLVDTVAELTQILPCEGEATIRKPVVAAAQSDHQSTLWFANDEPIVASEFHHGVNGGAARR